MEEEISKFTSNVEGAGDENELLKEPKIPISQDDQWKRLYELEGDQNSS